MSKMEQLIRNNGYKGKYCVGVRRFFGPYTLVCCHTRRQVKDMIKSYKEWDEQRSIGCCNPREWGYSELNQLLNSIFDASGCGNNNYAFKQFSTDMLIDHTDLS